MLMSELQFFNCFGYFLRIIIKTGCFKINDVKLPEKSERIPKETKIPFTVHFLLKIPDHQQRCQNFTGPLNAFASASCAIPCECISYCTAEQCGLADRISGNVYLHTSEVNNNFTGVVNSTLSPAHPQATTEINVFNCWQAFTVVYTENVKNTCYI